MNTPSSTTRVVQSLNTLQSYDVRPDQARPSCASIIGIDDAAESSADLLVRAQTPPQKAALAMVLDNASPADVKMPSQKEFNLLLSVVTPAAIKCLSKQYHLSARRFKSLLDGEIPRATLSQQDSGALRAFLTGSQDPEEQAKAGSSQAVIRYLRRCLETAFGVDCPAQASFVAPLDENNAQTVCDIEAVSLVRKLRQLCQESPKRARNCVEPVDSRLCKRFALPLPVPPAPSAGVSMWSKASDPRLAAHAALAASTTFTDRATDPRLARPVPLTPVEELSTGILGASTCTLGQQLASGCSKPNITLNDHVRLLDIGARFLASLKSDTQVFVTAQQQAYELKKTQLEQRDQTLVNALTQVTALRAQAQQEKQQLDQRDDMLAQTKRMLGL